MDLNNILAQLGMGQRDSVYLSVTPGVGLELIQLDLSSRSVKNYAFRPLDYDEANRKIVDMEDFRRAVTELFAESQIELEQIKAYVGSLETQVKSLKKQRWVFGGIGVSVGVCIASTIFLLVMN